MQANTLSGGFTKPAAQSAQAFRSVLEAMARPGTIQDIEGAAKPWLGRGSREDRASDERDTFAEQWEAMAGFSLTDEDAMAKWEDALRNHTSDSVKGLHERQAAEAKFTDSFAERLAAIQQKRMKQQGR